MAIDTSETASFLLGEDFENIIRRFYLAESYKFIEANPQGKGYDFMVEHPSGQKMVIEAKVYRTKIVQRADIVRAVMAVEEARRLAGAEHGRLFISSVIAIPVRDTGKTELIDVRELYKSLRAHPALIGELEALVDKLAPMPWTPEEKISWAIFGDGYTPAPEPEEAKPVAEPEPLPLAGKSLCETLRSVPPSNEGASEFEERCYEAVRYIFDNHFSNWKKQQITDGGISRYDVVARISSTHDLWRSIVSNFHTWYIVFEFKNYKGKISQGQIYTTEKYLFAGAMRTVAVLISREGADDNAMAATRGAARELGKLIIHLTIEDICKMLTLKDTGGDPNSVMFDIIDDMLMKLER